MTDRYTRTAIALHWTMAALVIMLLAMGWIMTDMVSSPLKLRLFDWHKWTGVTVLAFCSCARLWRLTHPAPALLPMPAWQRRSAQLLHGFLYLMLLLQPITGWLYSNAAGRSIVYLGLIPLPNLVGRDKALAGTLRNCTVPEPLVLSIAVGLHVLAALKHHLIDHDDTCGACCAGGTTDGYPRRTTHPRHSSLVTSTLALACLGVAAVLAADGAIDAGPEQHCGDLQARSRSGRGRLQEIQRIDRL